MPNPFLFALGLLARRFKTQPRVPHAVGSVTSRESAEAMVPVLGYVEGKVLKAVRDAGEKGLICDEAERILGLTHQCCSARFHELERRKLIKRTETKRTTRSKRNASVYVAVVMEKAA